MTAAREPTPLNSMKGRSFIDSAVQVDGGYLRTLSVILRRVLVER
jgi:hypothetical protein